MWLVRLLLALFCLTIPARAAEFTLRDNYFADQNDRLSLDRHSDIDYWVRWRWDCYHQLDSIIGAEKIVHISGRISTGDRARFGELVAPFATVQSPGPGYECPKLVVTLDIPGGQIVEAIAIGRRIAALGLPTIIGPDMQCLSACIFVFAGGSFPEGWLQNTIMFSGAKLGLHKPQFRLTDRQRQQVEAAPDPLNLVFGLAGATWAEISTYLINERRNPYLFRAMFDSPTSGEAFSFFDTYEELYRAGIVPIDMNRLPNRQTGRAMLAPGEVAQRLVSPEFARHVCALPKIKSGLSNDFSDSYAKRLGSAYVVGVRSIETFCYVTAESDGEVIRVCSFDRTLFRRNEGPDMPGWLQEWSIGAMGNFPIIMFESDIVEMGARDEQEIAAFLGSREGEICANEVEYFRPQHFTIFDASQRLDPACAAPTRLCEPGEPFRLR